MSSLGATAGTVSNQVKPSTGRTRGKVILGLAISSVLGSTGMSLASDIVKANNSSLLNVTGSWVGSVAPGSLDYAVWNTASGSTSSTLSVALGGNVSWLGIKIQSTALGVQILDTANTTLSLGAGGIDMTVASQNLTINSPLSITAATSFTFAGASARTINLWTLNGTRGLTGTTSITLARLAGSTTHTLAMQPGFSGSVGFNDTGANSAFSGGWIVGTGTKITNMRNGATAWGTGTITLNGGTISQVQGSWDWNNAIAVGAAGGTIGSETTGTNNYMVLSGVLSGSSTTLGFTGSAGTLGEGIILTGSNTFTGNFLINSGAIVRVGGAGNTTTNSSAGGTLGSISASVAITNNGALNFGRTDGQTFANYITGSGNSTVITGASVNLTGTTNSYTGTNTLVGTMTAVKIANGGSVSSIGSSSAAASNLVFNGGTLNYSGSSDITDRSFTMASNANIRNIGGSLTFTNTGTITQSGTASPRTLTLGGTSVANNIFGLILSDSGTSANISSLVKAETGKWILTSNQAYTGTTTISGGTLQLGNGGSAGTLGSGAIANAGTLAVNLNSSYSMPNAISGAGSLQQLGAGTTILAGSSSYNGSTYVAGGTLLINGANASKVTVAGSAVLGGTGTIAPASGTAITVSADGLVIPGSTSNTGILTAGSVTFAANSGLQYTWNGAGFAKLNSTGTLDVSDTGVTINIIGTPTGAPGTTYDLIDYNLITGTTNASNFNLFGSDPRAIFSMTEDTTNGIYQLVYGGQDYPQWMGNLSSVWDTSTQNWQLVANQTATTYVSGDNTYFDDTAVNYTVSLAGNVTPNSITVDNSANNYLFNGTGNITGATGITKVGTATLTLANTGTNAYTGLTDIQVGTLKIGATGALSTASTVAITGGAMLDLGGFGATIPGLTGAGVVSNSSSTLATLNLNIAGTNTFAGNIQNGTGPVAITKTGAGKLVLSGTNSYTGLTDVQNGSINVGSSTGLSSGSTVNLAASTSLDLSGFSPTIPGLSGSGTVTNSSGTASTLTVNSAATTTFAGTLQNGPGVLGFTKAGAGVLTLGGSNSYSGTTSITGGTLKAGATGSLSSNSVVSMSSSTTLDLNGFNSAIGGLTNSGPATVTNSSGTSSVLTVNLNSASRTFTGIMANGAGPLGLSLSGPGTMTLGGVSTFSGLTSLLNTLVLKTSSATALSPNSTLSMAVGSGLDLNGVGNTVAGLTGSGTIYGSTPGGLVISSTGTQTFAGSFDTGASYVKTGTGLLVLSGTNLNAGSVNITGGTLRAGSSVAIGNSSPVSMASPATLDLGGFSLSLISLDGSGSVTNSGGSLSTLTLTGGTFSGNINNGIGGLSLVKTTGGMLVLGGTNTYTGLTSVTGGTLKLASALALDPSSTVSLTGGQLDLAGFSPTLAALTGTGTIHNSGGTLSVLTANVASGTDTFAGSIQNSTSAVALTKSGLGQLLLGATSTYTGTTNISGGTLALANTGDLSGTSTILVSSGATFDVSAKAGGFSTASTITGAGTINGSLNANGAVQPGTGVGTLSFTGGNLVLGATATSTFELQSSSVYDKIVGISNFTAGGTLAVVLSGGGPAFAAGQTYDLLDWTGSAATNTFASITLPSLSPTLTWDQSQLYTTGAISVILSGPPTSAWNVNADGNWGTSSNWTSSTIPTGAGAVANFGSVITAPHIVTLDSARTVGSVNFTNASKYTIAGANTLTLDTTTGNAAVTVSSGSHDITAPLALAKDTTITVTNSADTLNVTNLQTTAQSISKAGAGTLQVNTVRATGLDISGGTVKLTVSDADGAGPGVQGAPASVAKVTNLSLTTSAKLDLGNNSLIIPASGQLNGSAITVATLRAALIAGRGGVGTGTANWSTAGGIGSSSFTLESANSLGYIWNADPNLLILGGITSVNGEAVTSSDYAVKFTKAGDANLDGVVDNIDVGIIGLRYLSTLGNQWYQGDFNYDGVVNNDDVAILGLAYSPSASPLSPSYQAPLAESFSAAASVVPEPKSVGLLAVGAMGLLRRRRR